MRGIIFSLVILSIAILSLLTIDQNVYASFSEVDNFDQPPGGYFDDQFFIHFDTNIGSTLLDRTYGGNARAIVSEFSLNTATFPSQFVMSPSTGPFGERWNADLNYTGSIFDLNTINFYQVNYLQSNTGSQVGLVLHQGETFVICNPQNVPINPGPSIMQLFPNIASCPNLASINPTLVDRVDFRFSSGSNPPTGDVVRVDGIFVDLTIDTDFLFDFSVVGPDVQELNRPDGIALDNQGNIFVADTFNGLIQKFDSTGNIQFPIGVGIQGSGDGEFNVVADVALDSSGNVYAADRFNHRIQKFDSNGNFLGWLGKCTSGANCNVPDQRSMGFSCTSATCSGLGAGGGTGLSQPSGIFIDNDNNIYVSNRQSNNIRVFDSTGDNLLLNFGGPGVGDAQFNISSGIASDSNGKIYVADRLNHRIQVFDSSGSFLFMFGQGVNTGASTPEVCFSGCQAGLVGSGNGEFNQPFDVTVDNIGRIYVSDRNNDRIQIFNPDGTFVTAFGTQGFGNGEFQGPQGITVNEIGNIFVVDNEGNRVQVFGTPRPTLEAVAIFSDNADPTIAEPDDNVIVNFIASEPIQSPSVTINGQFADIVTNIVGNTWEAIKLLPFAPPEGLVTFTIDVTSLTGIPGFQVTSTTGSSSVTIDDGITSDVDVFPGFFSDEFNDGITSGFIDNRGDRFWFITDEPNSPQIQGVRIIVSPGSEDATVKGDGNCEPRITNRIPFSGANFVLTCSSSVIQVFDGFVISSTTVNDQTITATVEAGGGVEFNLNIDGDLEVTNLSTTDSLLINVDGTEISIDPDETEIVDSTPPQIIATLEAIDVESDEGEFRVVFTAIDNLDPNPIVTADINGIPVENGQIVGLELDDETESEFDDGVLEIEAPSFTLTVVATDNFGNTSTETVSPEFVQETDDEDDEEDEED